MIEDSPYSQDELAFGEALLGEGMSFDAIYQRLQDQGLSAESALALRNDLYERLVLSKPDQARPFLSAREYDGWAERQCGATPEEVSDNRSRTLLGVLMVGSMVGAGFLAGVPIGGIIASALVLAIEQARRHRSWPFS